MVELLAVVILFDKNRGHRKHPRSSPLGLRHLEHVDCPPVFRSLFTPVSMSGKDGNRTLEHLIFGPSASHFLPSPPDPTCFRSSEKPELDKRARFQRPSDTTFHTTISMIPLDIDEAGIGGMPPSSSRTAACTHYRHENGGIPAYLSERFPVNTIPRTSRTRTSDPSW
jgi:hypothetical protein